MTFTRDSIVWWVGIIGSLVGIVLAQADALGLPPKWKTILTIILSCIGAVSGKLATSPLPVSPQGKVEELSIPTKADVPPKTAAILLLCLLIPTLASAQIAPLPTAGERHAADVARWIIAAGAIVVEAADCRHAPDERRCFVTLGVREGVVQGASMGIAKLFPRLRPCAPFDCGIDNPDNDIPSRHVGATMATMPLPRDGMGSRFVVAVSSTALVAILSGKAGKHDLIGIATGALVGYGASFIR